MATLRPKAILPANFSRIRRQYQKRLRTYNVKRDYIESRPQRLQVAGWVELQWHTQLFEKVRPVASQCGSKTSGQMQMRELCGLALEANTDKTINSIEAAIFIVIFIVFPLGELFITLVRYF